MLQLHKNKDFYDVCIDGELVGTYSNQEFKETSGRLVCRGSLEYIQKHGQAARETLWYFGGAEGRPGYPT